MAHDLWWHSFLWLKPTKKDSAVLSIKWKRITDKKEMVLWGTTLLLIVLITVNTVLNTTYLNWDDETGCANSVGAWYTDLVNRTAPESGELKKAFYDKKYVIAGWSIFSSMLAVLTDIHPAVINRMLLPIYAANKKRFSALIIIQAPILQTAELSAGTSSEWEFYL